MRRILEEQVRCRDYILNRIGPDIDGAWRGLGDWVMEEILGANEMNETEQGRERWVSGLNGRVFENTGERRQIVEGDWHYCKYRKAQNLGPLGVLFIDRKIDAPHVCEIWKEVTGPTK